MSNVTTAAAPPAAGSHSSNGHGHGDGHGLVAHHFENLEQQREANTLGMWLFLASEILFFGGVFTAYTVMRYRAPEGFSMANHHLNVPLGGVNTAVLLTSSLTMALAVWASQNKRRDLLKLFLGLTLIFGTAFLGIKAYEWYHEYEMGLVPGAATFGTRADGTPALTEYEQPHAKAIQMFFIFYFSITGLHALHMIIGLAVLGIQWTMAARHPQFGIADYTPIEISGLYWHFVDVVWIFVYPLLYLLK